MSDTVPIDRELLAKVLAIADEGVDLRERTIQHVENTTPLRLNVAHDHVFENRRILFIARRALQGEQEPTFDPDEEQPGEVRHRTDVTA